MLLPIFALLSILFFREMKRPRALTVFMWFCAIYAIGAVIGIGELRRDCLIKL